MRYPFGDYSTRASAAAGRNGKARQPPIAPANSPPAIASTTARATAPSVTGTVRWTDTVWAAAGAACASRLLAAGAACANRLLAAEALAVVAVRGGASAWTRAAAPKPMATPSAPPTMPMTSASPMIWRMIRRLPQPIALRVPNSRTRRVTADTVRMLASPNAAASTATASHLPRLLARVDALDSDPVTSLARLLEVVTVAVGKAREISLETAPMSAALAADT